MKEYSRKKKNSTRTAVLTALFILLILIVLTSVFSVARFAFSRFADGFFYPYMRVMTPADRLTDTSLLVEDKSTLAAKVEKLIYWQLSKKDTVIEKGMSEILQRIEQNLRELLNLFDFETTAYICHPNPKKVPEYSDYEHLARVKEWYVNEGEDD